MKKIKLILAWLLAAAMLTGCAGLTSAQSGVQMVKYEDMEYVRPDMNILQQSLDAACEAAKGDDLKKTVDAIYAFYDEYDAFYTNYSLADIKSCCDLTDIYWGEEYAYCMEQVAQADAALEELYYALADSPCREELESEEYFGEGYFDAYDGENIYDEGLVSLLEQEAELITRYYDLSAMGTEYEYGSEEFYEACGNDMVQLLQVLL